MDLEKSATAGTRKYIAEERWNTKTHVEGMIPQEGATAADAPDRSFSTFLFG